MRRESEEVEDAVGAARESVKKVLAEKQYALSEAKGRYNIAREMRDEEGMGIEAGKVDALRVIISEIEAELLGQHEVEGVRRAKDRTVAIRRALGSAVSEIVEDDARVLAAVASVAEAIARLNGRYSQIVTLRAEAAALADRFALPKPILPDVEAPARRAVAVELTRLPNTLRDTAWGNQPTEECEFKMRTRRTYSEVSGTPGAEIIATAGLKPFPALTKRQNEIIGAKAREKEQALRVMAGLPKLPAEGHVPLGSL